MPTTRVDDRHRDVWASMPKHKLADYQARSTRCPLWKKVAPHVGDGVVKYTLSLWLRDASPTAVLGIWL